MTEYYAHKSEDSRLQPLEEHLKNTAELASKFAADFGASDAAYVAGLYHDAGKATKEFQCRLLDNGPRVDHSSAGAIVCENNKHRLEAACIAGHHNGLYDFGGVHDDTTDSTYFARLKRAKEAGCMVSSDVVLNSAVYPDFRLNPLFISTWTRMLFSCLVDADFLDTENFMKPKERENYDSVEEIKSIFFEYLSKFPEPENELNKIRNQIQKECISAGNLSRGLFSLTVPTGGGKTLSSLAFALQHAVKNNMKRIIYVVPYTNIIEQTADVFRKIIGDKNVLEHHFDVDCFDEDTSDENEKKMLAAENWDSPVIVTTAVQFFESFYASKSSKCRKLHNITNSVIIFDEVQSIPVQHLRPCVAAIGLLVEYFNSTAVLCSATQPYISDILGEYAPSHPVKEMCSAPDEIAGKLKRVNFINSGELSFGNLKNKISEHEQVLCIVNTRKSAKKLYDVISAELPDCFHLSTLMTPFDRKETLNEIRARLKEGRPCRVVSTSLVEAGVDIDFPAVMREIAGVDSIIQAGGRCNREGKNNPESSLVYYFTLSDEKIPNSMRINVGATNEVLYFHKDIADLESIKWFFRSYRDLIGKSNIDAADTIKKLCCSRVMIETAAKEFHLIDNITKTVYIPCKENLDMINRIRDGSADRYLFRKLGKYAVNIYNNHFEEFFNAGDIEMVGDDIAILSNLKQYNKQTGLSLTADTGRAEFI